MTHQERKFVLQGLGQDLHMGEHGKIIFQVPQFSSHGSKGQQSISKTCSRRQFSSATVAASARSSQQSGLLWTTKTGPSDMDDLNGSRISTCSVSGDGEGCNPASVTVMQSRARWRPAISWGWKQKAEKEITGTVKVWFWSHLMTSARMVETATETGTVGFFPPGTSNGLRPPLFTWRLMWLGR